MHKKRLLAARGMAVVMLSAMTLSGCAPKREGPNEVQVPVQPVQAETPTGQSPPTEAVTEAETQAPETEAPPQLSVKDLQISVPKTPYSGTASVQVSGELGEASGTFTYRMDGNAFSASSPDGAEVYSDSRATIACKDGVWEEATGRFLDIWDLVHEDGCTMEGDGMANGQTCYHLRYQTDDQAGPICGICASLGYKNALNGTCVYDFYVSQADFSIVRLDISMPFMAESNGETGQCSTQMSFATESTYTDTLVRPDVQVEQSASPVAYEKGTLQGNLYKNEFFGIQIAGKDLFSFNGERTEELSGEYESMGSSYLEEAYGEKQGVIVNISSIPAYGDTKENVMAKYLQDSSAQDIQTAPNISVGRKDYSCATASVNGTSTKTYCTQSGGECLLITVYFNSQDTPQLFEGGMFGLDEDPDWQPDSWELLGKYTAETPSGYSVAQDESSDVFVCMKGRDQEVNIFALEGSALEDEVAQETSSDSLVERSVQEQRSVALDNGLSMEYLCVLNTEQERSYYTYVGLVSLDTAVIKIYVVSTAQTDLSGTFAKFADLVSVSGAPAGSTDGGEIAEPGTETAQFIE